jgi:hypothetical protein
MKFFKKMVFIFSLCIIAGACKTVPSVKVENFTVSMKSPNSKIGEIDLQLDQFFGLGNFKKQNVDVFYYPKEDAVCLVYKYEFYTYHQFWDKKGRDIFLDALKKYNEDYNAHNLQKSNKSQQKYGSVRGYLVWQQLSITVQAHANMDVDLGYTFKNNSPYFTIYQRAAEYTDNRARDNNRVSPNLSMFFTRAQAANLAEIFEQHKETQEADSLEDDFEYDEYGESNTPPVKNDAPKDAY